MDFHLGDAVSQTLKGTIAAGAVGGLVGYTMALPVERFAAAEALGGVAVVRPGPFMAGVVAGQASWTALLFLGTRNLLVIPVLDSTFGPDYGKYTYRVRDSAVAGAVTVPWRLHGRIIINGQPLTAPRLALAGALAGAAGQMVWNTGRVLVGRSPPDTD